MPITEMNAWLGGIAITVSLGTTFYAWFTSRSKVNEEHLKNVDTKLIDHDRRIQTVEGELRHMPAKDDVNELKVAMAKLEGSIGRLDENLNGVNRTVRRVEEYLQEKSK